MYYHTTLRNADGSALRARCNGTVKTWKTRPYDFRVPVKHGLKKCFYITNVKGDHSWTPDDWLPYDPTVLGAKQAWEAWWLGIQIRQVLNLAPDTLDEVVQDKWVEEGWQQIEDTVKKVVSLVWGEIQHDAMALEDFGDEPRVGLDGAVELCLDAHRLCEHGMSRTMYDRLHLLPQSLVDGWAKSALEGYFYKR
jgi:hypothetical protein